MVNTICLHKEFTSYHPYKGIDYNMVIIDSKMFFELSGYKRKFTRLEDMYKYVDKVILRKKKLERLKLI